MSADVLTADVQQKDAETVKVERESLLCLKRGETCRAGMLPPDAVENYCPTIPISTFQRNAQLTRTPETRRCLIAEGFDDRICHKIPLSLYIEDLLL